jgi:uncharacterized membrane protein
MGHFRRTAIPQSTFGVRYGQRRRNWRAGALGGSLSDYGINDDFIKSLAETIPNNSSALFILVRKTQPEKVLGNSRAYRAK